MYKSGFYKQTAGRYYNDMKATREENETFLPPKSANKNTSIHMEMNSSSKKVPPTSREQQHVVFKLVKFTALALFLVLLVSIVRNRIVDSEGSSSSTESVATESSFVFRRLSSLNRTGVLSTNENYDECKYLRYASIDGDDSNELNKLCDLTVTVKTTKNNHFFKLKTIVDTWYRLAPSKVFFVTDHKDAQFANFTSKK
jgi:hypothetical protein